jgi:flagellin-like protein
MNVRTLFTDDSAVSPVIGVVLMVAITVLLAATAATFFLGIGQENTNATPQAAFSFEYAQDTETRASAPDYRTDTLKISHDTGDTVTAGNLDVAVSGAKTYEESSDSTTGLDERFRWDELDSGVGADSSVSGGTSGRVNANNVDSVISSPTADGLNLDGATVKLVWDDPGSDSTFTLNSWTD